MRRRSSRRPPTFPAQVVLPDGARRPGRVHPVYLDPVRTADVHLIVKAGDLVVFLEERALLAAVNLPAAHAAVEEVGGLVTVPVQADGVRPVLSRPVHF